MSKTKKKIIICSMQVPFVVGGAELQVANLNAQLLARGYQSTIVNIPFKWYPKNEIMKHALVWRILDLSEVDGQKIDLVIGTKFPTYGVRHDNKITWLIHQYRQLYDLYLTPFSEFTDSLEDKQIRQMVINFDNTMLPESKKIYAESKTVAARLLQYNNLESEPLYHPPKHIGRYYCENFENYILTVNRLEPAKRVDLLIKSMQYTNPEIRCLIVGQGPEHQTLAKLIDTLNLQDRVQLLGFVDDEKLLELYANAGAVFYTPFDEDYGYVTLEAFLSKKPLITTHDAGGVLEFVKENQSALVTKPKAITLGESINQLISNKKKAQEMGKQGFDSVQYITWDNVIDALTHTLR